MSKPEKKICRGVIVPMVTPFSADMTIDAHAFGRILENIVKAKAAPFVLGTTGESTSLSDGQKAFVVKTMVDQSPQQVPTFAGISGNCLSESIDQAKAFADIGVDQVVLHLPFYYPISPDGMLKYFEQVANSIQCPLVLYNNPITVKQSIPVDVIDKLSHHQNIVGIKDSERSLDRLEQSLALWANRNDFAFYLGWATQSAYAVKNGADGIVPSTGNLAPRLYQELYENAADGRSEEAEALQKLTNNISEIYQKDRNISQAIPALKIMMSEHGLCQHYVMPPLYGLSNEDQEKVKNKMKTELSEENVG